MATSSTATTTTTTTTSTPSKVRVEPAPMVITQAGKVAIVTGASRGIGAAIATRLARDGAKVIVNYHSSPTEAGEVVAVIRSSGGTAEAVKADASSIEGADFLFNEAKRLYGGVDIVVANAGVFASGPVSGLSEADYDKLFSVNVKGVAFLLKNAANLVRESGRIIYVGSTVHRGWAGMGAYAATKAAGGALASSLALELASKKITVNSIHPGYTDTDMLQGAFPSIYEKSSLESQPMKRLGTPGDIADAVSLFASEQARWMTGQQILVTGGLKD